MVHWTNWTRLHCTVHWAKRSHCTIYVVSGVQNGCHQLGCTSWLICLGQGWRTCVMQDFLDIEAFIAVPILSHSCPWEFWEEKWGLGVFRPHYLLVQYILLLLL
jgi:hypothetical protein